MGTFTCKILTIPCSLESIRNKMKVNKAKYSAIEGRKFLARITTADNGTAEEELRKEITKDMFSKVSLILMYYQEQGFPRGVCTSL